MQVIPLFILVLPLLILGLTTGRWFKWFSFVKKLRVKSKKWDEEGVDLPTPPVTIKRLRNHQNFGDKMVVSHHLARTAADVESKIRSGIFKITFITFVLIISVSMVLVARASANQSQPTGVVDGLAKVFGEVPYFLIFPVGFIGYAIESVVLFFALYDQATRYNHVLDEPEEATQQATPNQQQARGANR